jgi:cation diffusion facilitator family transporter
VKPGLWAPTADRKPLKETVVIRRIALAAFILNLALAVMKGVLAGVSNSLALTASVIDSATDSFASLAVFIGVLLSTKKTKQFPLGLYKIENVISVVIAIFIFFAGYEIAKEIFFSEGTLQEPMSLTTVLLLAAATIVIFIFGRIAKRVGEKTRSPTLIAEGKHRFIDFLSSAVVLVSALLSYFSINISIGNISIDKIAAGIVLLFILKAGWELLADGMRVLLDASVDHTTLAAVEEIVRSEPMVAGLPALFGRNAGRFRFIQATIEVRSENLEKAHYITEEIENKINNAVKNVERVFIHYEPVKKDTITAALPLNTDKKTISPHFGEAGWFYFTTINRHSGVVVQSDILKNPFPLHGKGKGLKVAEWLVEKEVDTVLVKENLKNRGPGYVFKNAGITIIITSENSVKKAVAGINNGKKNS